MSVQVSSNNSNVPFIRAGLPVAVEGTIAQDAARLAALAPFTVMAKIAASGKWAAMDTADVTGLEVSRGIYIGPSITAAAIIAGDVPNVNVLTGVSAVVDENQIIVEGAATLDTVVSGLQVRDALAGYGIIAQATVDISSFVA